MKYKAPPVRNNQFFSPNNLIHMPPHARPACNHACSNMGSMVQHGQHVPTSYQHRGTPRWRYQCYNNPCYSTIGLMGSHSIPGNVPYCNVPYCNVPYCNVWWPKKLGTHSIVCCHIASKGVQYTTLLPPSSTHPTSSHLDHLIVSPTLPVP